MSLGRYVKNMPPKCLTKAWGDAWWGLELRTVAHYAADAAVTLRHCGA